MGKLKTAPKLDKFYP